MTVLALDSRFAFGEIRAALERFLAIPTAGDEENLELWYTWALRDSSGWVTNSFVDSDGADTKTDADIKALKLALFTGVKSLRRSFNKSQGIKKLATGGVQEEYVNALIGSGIAAEVMAGLLYTFKLKVYLL
ncbi:MAG: hypothetical protein V3V34_11845 [Kiloniellales bacterium]